MRKKIKEKLKAELGRIKQGVPKNKSPEQTKTLNNINNLYNFKRRSCSNV